MARFIVAVSVESPIPEPAVALKYFTPPDGTVSGPEYVTPSVGAVPEVVLIAGAAPTASAAGSRVGGVVPVPVNVEAEMVRFQPRPEPVASVTVTGMSKWTI